MSVGTDSQCVLGWEEIVTPLGYRSIRQNVADADARLRCGGNLLLLLGTARFVAAVVE